jgi:hypothetical protein
MLDFNKIISEKNDADSWTPEQRIKLIEAIEKYGENWDEVLKVKKT